jgi:galactosylceramidase
MGAIQNLKQPFVPPVLKQKDGTNCLMQLNSEQGYDWMRVYRRSNIKPNILIGDVNWKNYTCSVDVYIDNGNVELGGRVTSSYIKGYRFMLSKNGDWKMLLHKKVLQECTINNFDGDIWHNLKLNFKGKTIEAFVDEVSITKINHKLKNGYVMLGSSYDNNLFDNLKINPKNSGC